MAGGLSVHDWGTGLLRKQAIAPQSIAATTTTTSIDMLLGDFMCGIELNLGAFDATSISVQVSECATTNGTYVAITAGLAAATTGTQFVVATFQRNQRYLQTVATVVGTTTPAILVAVTIVEALKVI